MWVCESVSVCVYVRVRECVFVYELVCQSVCKEYIPKAITTESVGGSLAKHSNLMKEVKCCHFNLHSVYHVVKILVQVGREWWKSSGV